MRDIKLLAPIMAMALAILILVVIGCATPPLSKESPLMRAFNGCEDRNGFYSLRVDKAGNYTATCEDMFQFKF